MCSLLGPVFLGDLGSVEGILLDLLVVGELVGVHNHPWVLRVDSNVDPCVAAHITIYLKKYYQKHLLVTNLTLSPLPFN